MNPTTKDIDMRMAGIGVQDIVTREVVSSMGVGPNAPKQTFKEVMLKIRWGGKPVYIKEFKGPIFYGMGDYSGWQSKNLKLQIRLLESMNSGDQQCGRTCDPVLSSLLKRSIRAALGII
jgi:hypothetical protein